MWLEDVEDSAYDEQFIVDKNKLDSIMADFEKHGICDCFDEDEWDGVRSVEYVDDKLLNDYINEDISYYNFMYNILTDISVEKGLLEGCEPYVIRA